VSLRRLLHSTHSQQALICMFLAMLELVRLQAVLLHQPRQLGDILIKKTDGSTRSLPNSAGAGRLAVNWLRDIRFPWCDIRSSACCPQPVCALPLSL